MYAFLLLLPAIVAVAAEAQLPGGNIYGGYSYSRFDQGNGNHAGMNGWEGALEGKVFPFVGVVADITGHYGTPGGITTREYDFLFGPRLSVSVGKARPFIHGLVGVGRINTEIAGFSDSDTSVAYSIGGGMDYKVIPLFAWRFQGGYVQTKFFGATQKDVRFSTGLVFSF